MTTFDVEDPKAVEGLRFSFLITYILYNNFLFFKMAGGPRYDLGSGVLETSRLSICPIPLDNGNPES